MAEHDPTVRRAVHDIVHGGTVRDPMGRELAVGAAPLTVGRALSSDLCIDDAAVSAAHCELRATARGVRLRDLGSTNGTLVGPVAIHDALLLQPCTIRLGDTELGFAPAAAPMPNDAGETRDSLGPLVGHSSAMRRIYRVIGQVAPTDVSVLVTGETGTGKELAAHALHELSGRAGRPFCVVDCGALPSGLAESILFGHERGAFTGATERVAGAFLNAQGGTVFLDEIGELPMELQPKLLRVLAERAVKRLGARNYEQVDVRVIAATRRDLRKEMNAQHFREDLYFRMAQFRIEMPPLRERLDDLSPLITAACERVGRAEATPRVTSYIKTRFRNYDWPGNVRELVNVAGVLASLGAELAEGALPLEARPGDSDEAMTPERFVQAKRHFEETFFRRLLDATDGNISEIARRCGLARHQVRAHLHKLGLMS